MVEDRFPSKQSKKTHARLEEELRILYVAVTRAKECLYLTWSNPSKISRFILQLRQVRTIENHKGIQRVSQCATDITNG